MSDTEDLFGDEEERKILEGTFVEKVPSSLPNKSKEEEEEEDEDLFGEKEQENGEDKKEDGSDNENNKNKEEDEDEDLFGEDEEKEQDNEEGSDYERLKKKKSKKHKKKHSRHSDEEDGDGDGDDMSTEKAEMNAGEQFFGGESDEEEEEELIRDPIELIHIETPKVRPVEKVMKIKLSNILGIQPKPFDPLTFEEDELNSEQKNKNFNNIESVIRWRWGLDSNGRPAKESNTRFVTWPDGSAHLFIGNEVLEIKEQDLRNEQFYVYSSQEGFIECESKIDSRINIRPANIRSKVHQRLSESVAKKSLKVSRIKSIQTTLDPEKEKEQREKELLETIRENKKKQEEENKPRKNKALTSDYLEDDEYDGYRNEKGDDFIVDDEEGEMSEDGDYKPSEDEESGSDEAGSDEDEYQDESDSSDRHRSSKSKKDQKRKDRDNKKGSKGSSSSSRAQQEIFGEDEDDEEFISVSKKVKRKVLDDDDE
ncbi:hypothetical protein DICPUDRAFT_157421 [Dictyostelium purpureum]|uniref:RNA polymerase-associated protein LEO1 n=1 Tax=Dictyostelium purpureum TaxID=5786 RepID=F0ZZ33_DICPU|nr:uncharacterized protein DICPUDRAFT_157421 [Dictyostelium purpureum]EGC30793.1 hypothetical protein DICPUDRAFT_157421 [Dictyostelium purpureum]|eukprot:XP_003292683.1 hypothetical protein DICPUDRAFT_157421 [Dictyostelium purpureum]